VYPFFFEDFHFPGSWLVPGRIHHLTSHTQLSVISLATNLNVPVLRKLTGIQNADMKSISLLENFLKSKGVGTEDIIPVLRNLNSLRQGFPVHGNNVQGVVPAYEFFKIEYPVMNYKEAWRRLMKAYLSGLEKLLLAIKSFEK
jgi:hypothetical protein